MRADKNTFLINMEHYITNVQKLNINNPVTIQDKIGWLKIFDNSSIKTLCTDKILLHDYCKQKLGKDICIPILKIYNSVDDIDLNKLPDKFVLKCNHGCQYNIIVTDKSKIDIKKIKEKLNNWLLENYALKGFEPQYFDIKPKCYVEVYFENNLNNLIDYKFLCFNGIPMYCQIISDRYTNKKYLNYYDMNFVPQYGLSRTDFEANYDIKDKKPINWELMKEISFKLAKDFKFVRVDLYEVDNMVYLGELTFTPGNGRMLYKNPEHGKMIGDMLKLN